MLAQRRLPHVLIYHIGLRQLANVISASYARQLCCSGSTWPPASERCSIVDPLAPSLKARNATASKFIDGTRDVVLLDAILPRAKALTDINYTITDRDNANRDV